MTRPVERPIEELFPARDALFFRPGGEIWLGSFDAKANLWAVANAEQRKVHRLTAAQMRTMFQGFAELR